jgi:hypothetical protein
LFLLVGLEERHKPAFLQRQRQTKFEATKTVIPAQVGYPVRCGFSIQSLLSLEYWITRAGDDD